MGKRRASFSTITVDGTSQADRRLAALDPSYAKIDERSTADLLAFVRDHARRLRYYDENDRASGDWSGLLERGPVDLDDIVAHVGDPASASGAKARWLERPHLGLLLRFLELLGESRERINELTGRHLSYIYERVLGIQRKPAVPDRVALAFRLAPGTSQLLVPAGTELDAGKDEGGRPRVYRSERDLFVTRAELAEVASVFVDRRVTGIADVRANTGLTARQVFEGKLALALGHPRPGDAVPPDSRGQALTPEYFAGLAPVLAACGRAESAELRLQFHELRKLMRLRQQRAAGREWPTINALMGWQGPPPDPRAFEDNLRARALAATGVELSFVDDQLAQVNSVAELYREREREEVRQFIEARVGMSVLDFEAMMGLHTFVERQWRQINALLELGGRRRDPDYRHLPADPRAFVANVEAALAPGPLWPKLGAWGIASLDDYDARLRRIEADLSTRAEDLRTIVALAEQVVAQREPTTRQWAELDEVLIAAHHERERAARREQIGAGAELVDITGLAEAVVRALGPEPTPELDEATDWTKQRARLEPLLDPPALALLDRFAAQVQEPQLPAQVGWDEVVTVLEWAQRAHQGLEERPPSRVTWRNLHAFADARSVLADPESDSPRWKTFGRRPSVIDPAEPPRSPLGWAIRSPLLELSHGLRRITLTLGLDEASFDVERLSRALGVPADEAAEFDPRNCALEAELSTEAGWVRAPFAKAPRVLVGGGEFGYWAATGVAAEAELDRPALQLELELDEQVDAIAALAGEDAPSLRLMLAQRWDGHHFTTDYSPFAGLELTAAHLRVEARGMWDLRLQAEDRGLDPAKPFEPFGARPGAGARLYLGHPELVRKRLDMLELSLHWADLPADLAAHYEAYGEGLQRDSFVARLDLIERSRPRELFDVGLFGEDADQVVAVEGIGAKLGDSYAPWQGVAMGRDLRRWGRVLCWQLGAQDFRHAAFPRLAARKATELVARLSGGGALSQDELADFQVEPPYTPKLQLLRFAYASSLELRFDRELDREPTLDRVAHVHPFGEQAIDGRLRPPLFPPYDGAGELYLGLRGVNAPERVSLLFQVAEGTSNPAHESAGIEWSYLDADGWQSLHDGGLLLDSTDNLINPGVVEFQLPAARPSALLPRGHYWLRARVKGRADTVCDLVEVRPQVVFASFDERGNDPSHYRQPLPVGTIQRTLRPNPRIAEVEQPFTSAGGRPRERAEDFHTRVSERLRHRRRAVTPWDYERLVLERFADIYKAKCLRGWPGAEAELEAESGRVQVVVIPDIRDKLPGEPLAPRASARQLADIRRYLLGLCAPHVLLRVSNPRYVQVKVRLGVAFNPGEEPGYRQRQLAEDLNRFLSPWAYASGVDIAFGGAIHANSIVEFVDRLDYVDYVASILLFTAREGERFRPQLPVDVPGYRVQTARDDEILVAAREHMIDLIDDSGLERESLTGIGHMAVDLDFIVA